MSGGAGTWVGVQVHEWGCDSLPMARVGTSWASSLEAHQSTQICTLAAQRAFGEITHTHNLHAHFHLNAHAHPITCACAQILHMLL